MPRYYCDYCDTYLTHDSPSVRKQHNQGYKHKANVRTYYQQFEEQQTQSFIDQKVKEVLHMGGAFMLPGQYRPPVIRPLTLPVPGSNPNSMVPPGRPLMPGYMTPPTFRPPLAAPPQGNGLPLPPAGGPPPGAPGVRPPLNATPAPNGNMPPGSVPLYQQGPPTSIPGSYNYPPPSVGPPGGYSQQQPSMSSLPGFGSAPPPGTLPPPPPGNFPPSSQTPPPTSSSYGPPTGGAPGYGS